MYSLTYPRLTEDDILLDTGLVSHIGVCLTSLRSLNLWCNICLQIQKYFPPDPAIFSPKNKIFILLYIVSRFMQNISIFHGKTARYDVLKIKFEDISHHRYKLRI
jgi:hypothetical protein